MSVYASPSRPASGWLHAALFNALLLVLPFLAARVIAGAFLAQEIGATPTPQALTETRRNIDQSFSALAPRGADERGYWADLVDRELRARDMSAARGFLLAAPVMLDDADARGVKAAASELDGGQEDDRVAGAALLYLPNDVRSRYERAVRLPTIDLPESKRDADGVANDESEASGFEDARAVAATVDAPRMARLSSASTFSVLGDFVDLADASRRWINGERVDPFVLRLTGLGMTARSARPEPVDIELAASILKSAHRAGRLDRSYARFLDQRLQAVISDDALGPRLAEAFADLTPRDVQAERVRAAFAGSVRADALPRLEEDFAQINRIAELTSPNGAIALLEHVSGSDDLRRARLLAEAGGDRAPALAKQIGADALGLAASGLNWSRAVVLQVMALAALGLALVWTLAIAVSRAVRRRPVEATII